MTVNVKTVRRVLLGGGGGEHENGILDTMEGERRM